MGMKVIQIAQAKGFTLLMAKTASSYAESCFTKNVPVEVVKEVEYSSSYSLYSELPDDVKKQHPTAALVVLQVPSAA